MPERNPIGESVRSFNETIAQTIGNSVDGQRVKKLIEISRKYGHIAHGVKTSETITRINKQGILPLTPEGGFVSMWGKGYRIFASSINNTPLQFFDTPFFHYAHSIDRKNNIAKMTLAVTNCSLFPLISQSRQTDCHLSFHVPVPRNSIILLCVEKELKSRSNIKKCQKSMQEAMFDQLENALIEGYSGGETRIIRL